MHLKQKLKRRTRHLLWAPQKYKTKSLEKVHRADQWRFSVFCPAPFAPPTTHSLVKVLGLPLACGWGWIRNLFAAEPSASGCSWAGRVFVAWFPGGSPPVHAALCSERQSAMAPRVWRRRTLERCLREVGKATDRPECFLT